MFKTIGQQEIEDRERIERLKLAPETANYEDVLWLILKLEIEQQKTIPNDGYYC